MRTDLFLVSQEVTVLKFHQQLLWPLNVTQLTTSELNRNEFHFSNHLSVNVVIIAN